MVEWNRIFWLFLFSGILGQAREVHLKFQNEILENDLSIRSSPEISSIFGRIESAPTTQHNWGRGLYQDHPPIIEQNVSRDLLQDCYLPMASLLSYGILRVRELLFWRRNWEWVRVGKPGDKGIGEESS